MDGTKEGIFDGLDEGAELGTNEGVFEGVEVGALEGKVEGSDVEGVELGKAVTSKFRQTSLTSQHTLQHLHTTSEGLSPSISARQSEESSSITVREEQRAFGTPPVRRFFSNDSLCNAVRKPS